MSWPTRRSADPETGLDNFGARYNSSTLGRFMTPDWAGGAEAVPYGNLEDPQSLNLYTYVENNPVSLIDPDGHKRKGSGDGAQNSGCPPGGCTVTVRSTPIEIGLLFFAGAVGHHGLPRGIFRYFVGKGTDGYKFWDRWTTGPLSEEGQAVNIFNDLPRAYNDAVEKIVREFLREHGTSFQDLTAGERAELQRAILDSDAPAIRNFLSKLDSASSGALDTLEGLIDNLDAAFPAVVTRGQIQSMNEQQCGAPDYRT